MGGSGTAGQLAVAALKLTADAAKVEGKAMTKLLDSAAEVAHNANRDPGKGQIIDTHA